MKPVILSLLVGIITGAIASAGDFATEMLEATFKLFHVDSTGTCVLVSREAPDRSLYVVTAAHVLERTRGDTAIVVLRKRLADGSYQRQDHTIVIRHDGKPLWVRHATEDIAVLRLAETPPVPVSALPLSAIVDEPRLAALGLHICSPLYVLTYPERFEANDAGFAVARQGIIASYPFLPVQRHHTFLSDFTTFAGDSGGPVFIAGTDGHPLLVGIVLAQFRHDEHVKMEYEERTLHHPLGLGSVLHSQFVRDTIEKAFKQEEILPK
ncbi:MAG TPA: serine protease [Verrucomicrobiales bacterium]|nr:serine protease [Verrucomicrobiales bacterium]